MPFLRATRLQALIDAEARDQLLNNKPDLGVFARPAPRTRSHTTTPRRVGDDDVAYIIDDLIAIGRARKRAGLSGAVIRT